MSKQSRKDQTQSNAGTNSHSMTFEKPHKSSNSTSCEAVEASSSSDAQTESNSDDTPSGLLSDDAQRMQRSVIRSRVLITQVHQIMSTRWRCDNCSGEWKSIHYKTQCIDQALKEVQFSLERLQREL